MIDDEIEQYQRAARRRQLAIWVVLAAAISAPFVYIFWRSHAVKVANEQRRAEATAYGNRPLAPFEAKELERLLEGLREDATALRPAWQAATRNLATLAIDSAMCRHRMTAPTPEAARSYIYYGSIDGNYFGDVRATRFAAYQAMQERWLDDRLAKAAQLVAGPRDRRAYEAAQTLTKPFVFAVVATVEPEVSGINWTYVPGKVTGNAYVFDFASRTIVCAGEIAATNDPTLDVKIAMSNGETRTEGGLAVLHRDLEIQVMRQLTRMHTAH